MRAALPGKRSGGWRKTPRKERQMKRGCREEEQRLAKEAKQREAIDKKAALQQERKQAKEGKKRKKEINNLSLHCQSTLSNAIQQ